MVLHTTWIQQSRRLSRQCVAHSLIRLAVFMAMTVPGGCSTSGSLPVGRPLAAPLMPSTIANREMSFWAANCRAKPQAVTQSREIAELVLMYINRGRDFREPEGADGYLLQVVPLDRDFRSIETPGEVTIALFDSGAMKANLPASPLRIWHTPESAIADYWVSSDLLDGYLFRLDWEKEPPPGEYLFWVQLHYRLRGVEKTICQKIILPHQGAGAGGG